MIEVDKLSKTFYVHKKAPGLLGSLRSLVHRTRIAKHAVREARFRVDEGEIVGLIGANGAGKTTLVKMLAGIIHPTSGDARVLGYRPWERDNNFRRQISLIMGQKAQLWWDLPAADCFLLLREIYEIPRPLFDERLDYLSSVLGVRDELNVQIRRLSLGERMKMELMAALLHAPRVVYLDEPTIGLDLTAQRAIREFILRYRQEHRPAMILTSHYMEDIERLCERIVIVREGEIVYDGPLARVVDRYASHKVVTARLDQPVAGLEAGAALDGIGRIIAHEELAVRVEVARRDVAAAAGMLLERLPVVDLSIDEEDVGTIIEKILRARREGEE